jgi:predicted phage terminase large subunit-like protein
MRTELNPDTVRAVLAARREQEAIAAHAAACMADFGVFVTAAWPVIEPVTSFVPNWHIDAVCDYLQAASRGEIDRLLINIPPRHMKSILVSVMWPAWIWTHSPHVRFLSASYGASLAERDAVRSRDLIRSGWYQQRWPQVELKGDVNRVSRYENTATGQRVATSVGGEATGEGGDVIIVDDPHKAEEAMLDAARSRVIDWHDGTLGHRFNNPKTGVEVVVMQRLHERDLSGHLLEQGGWTHLCLPARYELSHPFVWPGDPRSKAGELLWPRHFPERELSRLERTMTSFRAAGQLQQRPAALEGELLKRAWWSFYDPSWLNDNQLGRLPKFQAIVASWDTAFKDKTTSDYVVGQVWGIYKADRYLLYSFRQQANLQATKDAMRATHGWVQRRWPSRPHYVLIEKSANGVEILAELKREIPGVLAVSVSTDKITRAIAAAATLESGNVFLPGRADPGSASGYSAAAWVAALIEEAATFPNGRNDDQVDAYSQAINWVGGRRFGSGGSFSVPKGRIPDSREPLDPVAEFYRRRNQPSYTPQRRLLSFEELASDLGMNCQYGFHIGDPQAIAAKARESRDR